MSASRTASDGCAACARQMVPSGQTAPDGHMGPNALENLNQGQRQAIQNKCEGPRREIGLPILAELPYIKETRMEKLIMDTLVNAENASLLSIYQPGGQEYV